MLIGAQSLLTAVVAARRFARSWLPQMDESTWTSYRGRCPTPAPRWERIRAKLAAVQVGLRYSASAATKGRRSSGRGARANVT